MSKKYEIKILASSEGYANENLKRSQNEGWEIAGDILITKRKIAEEPYLYIPLKREIQDKPEQKNKYGQH